MCLYRSAEESGTDWDRFETSLNQITLAAFSSAFNLTVLFLFQDVLRLLEDRKDNVTWHKGPRIAVSVSFVLNSFKGM